MVVDSYVVVIMLRTGGADLISMPLIPLPALPPPWPPYRDVPDTTDDLPVTIGVRIDPVNNSSETDTFVQPTAGRDLEFYQLLPTQETFEPVSYTHLTLPTILRV